MMDVRTTRILVVTDKAEPAAGLLDAIRHRAATGDVQFRVTILNPAAAEIHLLHPDRHRMAAEAEQVLLHALPALETAAGKAVIGSVSVRHDPMDAIEETLASEPIDEIMLALPEHHVSSWLHQDLEHRLHHLGLPVTVVHPRPAQLEPS